MQTFKRLRNKVQLSRQLAPGRNHSLLTKDGHLWGCGYNDYGQLGSEDNLPCNHSVFTQVELLEKIVDIGTGFAHIALVTESGQLWVCGDNDHGQLGLGDNDDRNVFTRVKMSERVSQISVGFYHTASLTESDQVWVCGNNGFGQLGLGDEANRNLFTPIKELMNSG